MSAWRGTTGLGMAAMLASCAAFAAMDAFAKSVSGRIPGFEIAFFRVALSWPFVLMLIWSQGFHTIRTQNIRLHAFRSLIQAGSMLLFFTGLGLIPLAQTVAIEFSSPLIAVAFGALLFAEPLPLRRVLALLAGVAGLLIAIRPGFADVGVGQLWIMTSAMFWAGTILVVRILGRTESSTAQVFYVALFLTPVNLIAAVPFWVWPDMTELAALLAAAGLGTVALWFYGEALRLADLSAVMPLDFTKIIWAMLFGWAFFAEPPDLLTLAGGAVIFAAAVWLTLAERARDRAQTPTSID